MTDETTSSIDFDQLEVELAQQNKDLRRQESDAAISKALAHLENASLEEKMSNQLWRLNHLYKIIDKDGESVPFRMNVFQLEFYEDMWYFNIILKARQLGFSTLIGLVALDSALFNDNYSAGIIAHDLDSAKKLFESNIEYPYQSLPAEIKAYRPMSTDTVREFKFTNGSKIQVATSLRSGTFQFLHISEFGKICAKSPQKAREVVTGSIETVGIGNICTIESTAEGQAGYFFEYATEAEKAMLEERKLGAQDYKFFFFPWFREQTYRLNPEFVVITEDDHLYFNELERECDVEIDEEQRAWYVAKRKKLQEDMTREYPGTPTEAFEAAVEGAFLGQELKRVREMKRVHSIPHEPGFPVFTFWDIGHFDFTGIWFGQYIQREMRFLKYFEDNNATADYYARKLEEFARLNRWQYGEHYLPHDIEVTDWSSGEGKNRREVLEDLGVSPVITVESPPGSFVTQVDLLKDKILTARFDEVGCELGLQRLTRWMKKWDQTGGVYVEKEQKNESTHAASGLRMWAAGFTPPVNSGRPKALPTKNRTQRRGRSQAKAKRHWKRV